MSRFQQVFTAFRCAVPDSAWHRLQTHSERSTCPKMQCPRCWQGSENSGNGSVISIPQLRRCATCPCEQRRIPKRSFQRKRQTLRVYLTRRSLTEHFQRVCVCISYILRLKISSTLVRKFGEIGAKAHHRMPAKVRSYEESQARNANIFLMSCKKTELCAG